MILVYVRKNRKQAVQLKEVKVAQSCLTLCDPMDYTVYGILQASLLISWLQSPSAVILEPPKIKSATVSTVSPSISHEVMGPDAMILVLSQLFHSPLSVSSRGSLALLHFLP